MYIHLFLNYFFLRRTVVDPSEGVGGGGGGAPKGATATSYMSFQ